ncbi:MAG: response regulator [Clostridiales bacterium]|nr:response regulator [Clostridiales bacterium]
MTTVLIVDDEYLVRRGIRETIDWKSYGFEIVGEAANGIEGFEKYMELRPDIIITDVRMKRATGLDFIEKMKQVEDFDSGIVIISAYDDFSYVKKALENKVSAYLLKPIQEKELVSVMLRIQSEQKEKRQKENLMENVTRQLPWIRNNFLKTVLENKEADPDEIKEKFTLYDIPVPDDEYTVVCMKLDNIMSVAENTRQLQLDMEETLAYCAGLPNSLKFVSCVISDCSMALLIFHHDDNYKLLQSSISPLTDFLAVIQEMFETVTNRTISIGYSMGHCGVEELATAYKEAQRALSHKSFLGNNSIIDFITVPKTMNSALVFPIDDIEKILEAAKENDHEKAKKILDSFFGKVKKDSSIDIESLKDVILETSIMILRHRFRNVEEINQIYNRKLVPSNEIKRLETVDDIEHWTRELVDNIFEKPERNDKNVYVFKIKEYIKHEYNRPITVEDVASNLNISSYYLMHIFKEEMGITFNQYLTQVRISKAKEMLKSGQYKVYEVAEATGYKDASYFSYIFKKMTGVSPKKAMTL